MDQRKDYLTLRQKKGVNQSEFWKQVFVTQSGGSRYENERRVPGPVAELVRLRHELDIDTSKISAENAHLIRAILSGDLDASELESSASHCLRLMSTLSNAASELSGLSVRVNQVLGCRHSNKLG